MHSRHVMGITRPKTYIDFFSHGRVLPNITPRNPLYVWMHLYIVVFKPHSHHRCYMLDSQEQAKW